MVRILLLIFFCFYFKEAFDVGIYISKDVSVSLIYDHYSNLGLGNVRNQGMDSVGFRVGYYF